MRGASAGTSDWPFWLIGQLHESEHGSIRMATYRRQRRSSSEKSRTSAQSGLMLPSRCASWDPHPSLHGDPGEWLGLCLSGCILHRQKRAITQSRRAFARSPHADIKALIGVAAERAPPQTASLPQGARAKAQGSPPAAFNSMSHLLALLRSCKSVKDVVSTFVNDVVSSPRDAPYPFGH